MEPIIEEYPQQNILPSAYMTIKDKSNNIHDSINIHRLLRIITSLITQNKTQGFTIQILPPWNQLVTVADYLLSPVSTAPITQFTLTPNPVY